MAVNLFPRRSRQEDPFARFAPDYKEEEEQEDPFARFAPEIRDEEEDDPFARFAPEIPITPPSLEPPPPMAADVMPVREVEPRPPPALTPQHLMAGEALMGPLAPRTPRPPPGAVLPPDRRDEILLPEHLPEPEARPTTLREPEPMAPASTMVAAAAPPREPEMFAARPEPVREPPKMKPLSPLDYPRAVTAGLGAGTQTLGKLGGAALEQVGQPALGKAVSGVSEDLGGLVSGRGWGRDVPRSPKFTEDPMGWAFYALGQGLPTTLPAIATGGAGAAVGAAMKGAQGVQKGMVLGTLAASYAMGVGDTRMQVEEAGWKPSLGRDLAVMGIAVPYAMLDAILPQRILATFGDAAAQQAAKGAFRTMLETAAIEGGTEGAQSFLTQFAAKIGTGRPIEMGQIIEEAGAGAITGGFLGGAGKTLPGRRERGPAEPGGPPIRRDERYQAMLREPFEGVEGPAGPGPRVEPTRPVVEAAPAPKEPILRRIADKLDPGRAEELRAAERALEVDDLTGLGNRVAFDKARATAEPDSETAVIVFDVNNLKVVNDTQGHDAGDELLRRAGTTIAEVAPRAFHQSGDEFMVLVPTAEAEAARDQIEEEFGKYELEGHTVSITGTIGQTFEEADALLQPRKDEQRVAYRPGVEEAPRPSDVEIIPEPGVTEAQPTPAVQPPVTVTEPEVAPVPPTAEEAVALESIRGMAFRFPNGEIVEGTNHGEVYNRMTPEQQQQYDGLSNEEMEAGSGSMTSAGRFVDMEEAARISEGTELAPEAEAEEAAIWLNPMKNEADLEPDRFQYKEVDARTGEMGVLKDVEVWRPKQAGIIAVWRDPADGRYKVVNGHKRWAKAKALGVGKVRAMEIQAATAEEARTEGAKINIGEGYGTAVDAAKIFRQEGIMDAAALREEGIPMGQQVASDGLALANLQEGLFDLVARGKEKVARMVVIGRSGLTDEQQTALWQMLQKQEGAKKPLTNDQIEELTRFVFAAPTEQVSQETLFGTETFDESLALEKARTSAWVKSQLKKQARLFKFVAQDERAEAIEKAGVGTIDTEAAGALGTEAEQVAEVYDRLSTYAGPVSDALNAAVQKIRKGGSENAVRKGLLEEIRGAIQADLEGVGEPAPAEDLEVLQPAAEIEAPPTAPAAEVAPKVDLFGEPVEETVEQVEAMPVAPEGISDEINNARAVLSQFEGRTDLTPEDQVRYDHARSVVRRAEGEPIDAEELRAGLEERPPEDVLQADFDLGGVDAREPVTGFVVSDPPREPPAEPPDVIEGAGEPGGEGRGVPEIRPVEEPTKLLPEDFEGDYTDEVKALVKALPRHFRYRKDAAKRAAQSWRKSTKEEQREDIGAYIEGIGNIRTGKSAEQVKKDVEANPTLMRILRQYEKTQERARQELNDFMEDIHGAEYIKYLEDYILHFYTGPRKKVTAFVKGWAKAVPSARPRTLPTLEDAVEAGLTPLTQDVAELHQLWAQINWKGALNQAFVKELTGVVNADGEPIIRKPQDAPEHWPQVDHPAIQKVYATRTKDGTTVLWTGGARVDPEIYRPLQQVFERPFTGRIIGAIEMVNAYAKAAALTFSMFHHFALTESAQGALARAWNPVRGLMTTKRGEGVKLTTPHREGLRLTQDKAFMRDLTLHGVNIDPIPDVMAGRVNKGLRQAEIRTRDIMGLNYLTKGLRQFKGWWDKNLWNRYYTGLKAETYYTLVADQMKHMPEDATAAEIRETKEKIGSLVNDMFGGQEWESKFWLTPKGRQLMHILLLAPDWTLSNIRVAGRTFKDYDDPLTREILGIYWRNMILSFAALLAGAAKGLTGEWPWEQEPEHKIDIDVTKIMRQMPWTDEDDPRRYYIRPGKQFREVLRYLSNPIDIIGAKLSPVVQTAIENATGHQAGQAGWEMPWVQRDLGFYGSLAPRALSAMEKFVPFAVRGSNFGFTFPMSRGMNWYKAQKAYEDIILAQVDPSLYDQLMPSRDAETLKAEIDDAAVLNGLDPEFQYRSANTKVRSQYYGRMWEAIADEDTEEAERLAQILLDLGVEAENLKSSGRARGKTQEEINAAIQSIGGRPERPRRPSRLKRPTRPTG